MFQLTRDEATLLARHEAGNLRSQSVTSSYGGRRYLPYAFTEQGVAMLSSVLQGHKRRQQLKQQLKEKVRGMLNPALRY